MDYEIIKYFNEKLNEYKSVVKDELLSLFGSDYSSIIDEAINIPVVYKVMESDVSFYKGIYDSLVDEEKRLVDYFEEKVGNEKHYIVGVSSFSMTDFIRENIDSSYAFYGSDSFVSGNVLFNPSLRILSDICI